jgi:hypothetical protein
MQDWHKGLRTKTLLLGTEEALVLIIAKRTAGSSLRIRLDTVEELAKKRMWLETASDLEPSSQVSYEHRIDLQLLNFIFQTPQVRI